MWADYTFTCRNHSRANSQVRSPSRHASPVWPCLLRERVPRRERLLQRRLLVSDRRGHQVEVHGGLSVRGRWERCACRGAGEGVPGRKRQLYWANCEPNPLHLDNESGGSHVSYSAVEMSQCLCKVCVYFSLSLSMYIVVVQSGIVFLCSSASHHISSRFYPSEGKTCNVCNSHIWRLRHTRTHTQRHFFRNLGSLLLYAFIGTTVSTFVIGYGLNSIDLLLTPTSA